MSEEEAGRLEAELVKVKALLSHVFPPSTTSNLQQHGNSEQTGGSKADLKSIVSSGDERVNLLSTELQQMHRLAYLLSHGSSSPRNTTQHSSTQASDDRRSERPSRLNSGI